MGIKIKGKNKANQNMSSSKALRSQFYHQTQPCMCIVNAKLTFTYLTEINTYGIKHEHVNAYTWHQNKENTKQTLILTCEGKQAIKHVKQKL